MSEENKQMTQEKSFAGQDEKQEAPRKESFDGQDEKQEMTLEESFARLDEMLEKLENPRLPLEESFRLYQQGMELLASCNKKIDTVEKKILIMNGDGELDEF